MLAFIDESGQPHPCDANPIATLVALCMHERAHRGLSRELFQKKRTLLKNGATYELKATELLNRRTFDRISEKRELVEAIFQMIGGLDLTIFAIVIPRPRLPTDIPDDHLPRHHQYLFQRINALAEKEGQEALLVYDGHGMNIQGRNLAACVNNYIFKVAEYRNILRRIVDTPLFVDSRVTPGIQLADLVASVVRQYEQHELFRGIPARDAYLSAISRYYNVVRGKTRHDLRNDNGQQLWGIYTLREERLHEEDPGIIQHEDLPAGTYPQE